MKRDDLFEFGGGGSKARMLQYILFKAKIENYNYILTAGGPYSNFNRSLALLCKKYNFKMRLVLFDKNLHIQKDSLNKRILELCNVEIVHCQSYEVERRIEIEKKSIIEKGFKPFYIWGGGKSNEGVEAYKDCFLEVLKSVSPDYIFTALGTGTTFSGLLCGKFKTKSNTKIVGVSVAREKKVCESVISEILEEFDSSIFLENSSFDIIDDYLFGGYGYVSEELENFINEFIRSEGIILDNIYVGKALFGTVEYLTNLKENYNNKTIVFLNTGGIYNF